MGATETISTTVEWAMTLLRNPETMKKAQAEIAQVIGHDKKLEENDIKDLPYLNAVIKETLRLHPAAPLLAPRIAVTDTEFMGYRYPKTPWCWSIFGEWEGTQMFGVLIICCSCLKK
ncbi:hypothetical protein MKX01_036695 [Papaver californicum]|nr:hypothetical protein MKX01_036695 [Papaver californicum]